MAGRAINAAASDAGLSADPFFLLKRLAESGEISDKILRGFFIGVAIGFPVAIACCCWYPCFKRSRHRRMARDRERAALLPHNMAHERITIVAKNHVGSSSEESCSARGTLGELFIAPLQKAHHPLRRQRGAAEYPRLSCRATDTQQRDRAAAMLDDSLPTFRFQPSSDNPQHTLLYFTHNGSEPTAEYLLKRPSASESKNQYALGLVDVHYSSVIYGEVLIRPQWTQPSLSAAEARAQGGVSTVVATTPDVLPVSLYNPDQTIPLRLQRSSFKSDAWEFEMPEQTFKPPSASQIDQDGAASGIAELTPKVLFRWKRDSRLSKDMTCYLTGRSFGGKKSKEPDITVAMYRAHKHESTVVIYEPNMARVEVEDRKGLEVVLLLSAEVIRDLYLMPKQNPFNTSGAPVPVGENISTPPPPPAPGSSRPPPPAQAAYASGALGGGGGGGGPLPGPPPGPPPGGPRPGASSPSRRDPQQQAAIDAETKRLQAMVAEEERAWRSRDRRDPTARGRRGAATTCRRSRRSSSTDGRTSWGRRWGRCSTERTTRSKR
ncbi:hypothetical protein PWT90_09064 [Aphanocladium album]|nr:hypothetical protein PWT90_09064 [Aphanocladium album]